jgi:hypothetical protein
MPSLSRSIISFERVAETWPVNNDNTSILIPEQREVLTSGTFDPRCVL